MREKNPRLGLSEIAQGRRQEKDQIEHFINNNKYVQRIYIHPNLNLVKQLLCFYCSICSHLSMSPYSKKLKFSFSKFKENIKPHT
jgi:hypothetical protein